jgi:hypothetical protein
VLLGMPQEVLVVAAHSGCGVVSANASAPINLR